MDDGQTALSTKAGASNAWTGWLLFLLFGLVIVVFDAWDGSLFYGDLDDRMRALQVRELLERGNYFDLTLSFVAMPEPYVSHYSRLVDLPYYLIAQAAKSVLGPDGALRLAFAVWPPVMLATFLSTALWTARRINGGAIGTGPLLVMAALFAISILEFSPGRIDHHNMQILLMTIMVAGLVSASRAGGWVVGVVSALSIAVGLETIPYIAAGLGALALAGIFRPGRHHDQLTATGAGFALAAVPAAWLSLGAPGLTARYCDAIGAPWVSAIVASGAILAIVPLAWPFPVFRDGRGAPAARFFSLAIPALAAGAVLLVLFPECVGDPYANVQGIARELWFDRIQQEKSLFWLIPSASVPLAGLSGFFGFVTIAGLAHAVRHARRDDLAPIMVAAVAVASLLFFFFLFRSVRFTAAFVPLFVPAAFALRNRAFPAAGAGDPATRRWLLAGALLPLALIAAAYFSGREIERQISVFDQISFDECSGQDASVLSQVKGGIVLAGFATSFRVAEEAPRHKVAALPLHRASPGIKRMLTAFTATDPARRNEALAPYDYLAICARNTGLDDMDKAPLFAALVAGKPVAGLDPVANPVDSAFRLFRIDRENLR